MQKIDFDEFNDLVSRSSLKPRLKRELRFVASTAGMSEEEWEVRELIAISDRSGNKGALIISIESGLYLIPYELKSGITSSATGRSQSIICDFCQTWQYGDKSASITFTIDAKSNVSYLCCGDLRCSLHVRTLTSAAHTSRAQLREDLTNQQRINRLKTRLQGYIQRIGATPMSTQTARDPAAQ